MGIGLGLALVVAVLSARSRPSGPRRPGEDAAQLSARAGGSASSGFGSELDRAELARAGGKRSAAEGAASASPSGLVPATTRREGRVRLRFVDSRGRGISPQRVRVHVAASDRTREALRALAEAWPDRALLGRLRSMPAYSRKGSSHGLSPLEADRSVFIEAGPLRSSVIDVPGGMGGALEVPLAAAFELPLDWVDGGGEPLGEASFSLELFGSSEAGAGRLSLGEFEIDARGRALIWLSGDRLDWFEAAERVGFGVSIEGEPFTTLVVDPAQLVADRPVELRVPSSGELRIRMLDPAGRGLSPHRRHFRLRQLPTLELEGRALPATGRGLRSSDSTLVFERVRPDAEYALEIAWDDLQFEPLARFQGNGEAQQTFEVEVVDRVLRLRGRVLGADSAALDGVDLDLEVPAFDHRWKPFGRGVKTDARGNFRARRLFDERPQGPFNVVVTAHLPKGGRECFVVEGRLGRYGNGIDLGVLRIGAADTPAAGETLELRAVGPDDTALSARLRIERPGPNGAWVALPGRETRAMDQGRLRFAPPAGSGPFLVRVESGSRYAALPILLSAAQQQPGAALPEALLRPRGGLRGRVEAPEQVELVARPQDLAGNLWTERLGASNRDGRFRTRLPAGRWTLGLIERDGGAERLRIENVDVPEASACLDPRLELLQIP